jgi:hypothetical protein
MITKFNNFVNEGVVDKMTPKSHEYIRNHVKDYTPDQKLTLGCQQGILWLVKEAIEEGANYNNYSVLGDASRYNQLEIVKYLIEDMGVDVNINDDYALKNAVINGRTDITEYLIDKGANVNYRNGYLFYISWDKMEADMCRLLVKKGLDLQSFVDNSDITFHPAFRNFIKLHFPNIDVSKMKLIKNDKTKFWESVNYSFKNDYWKSRYGKHFDNINNAKPGDVLDNEDVYLLVEYLTSQAGKYEESFDEEEGGDLGERLERYRKYRLEEVPVDRIDLTEWSVDKDVVREYRDLYTETHSYPPIVLDHRYGIIDGIHRANGLKLAGLDKILAFVGIKN